MKLTHLFLTVFLFILLPFRVHAGFLQEPDKQKHIVISAVGATTFLILGSMDDPPLSKAQAFGAMLAIGIAKEIYDGNGNTPREHFRDLAGDVLGAGIVFTYRF